VHWKDWLNLHFQGLTYSTFPLTPTYYYHVAKPQKKNSWKQTQGCVRHTPLAIWSGVPHSMFAHNSSSHFIMPPPPPRFSWCWRLPSGQFSNYMQKVHYASICSLCSYRLPSGISQTTCSRFITLLCNCLIAQGLLLAPPKRQFFTLHAASSLCSVQSLSKLHKRSFFTQKCRIIKLLLYAVMSKLYKGCS
jgi:hypothetical protein